MKKVVLASVIVLCGACVPALAQNTETPPKPGAAAPPAAERDGAKPSTQPGVPRANDPNATGDDKVNGLEAPEMKNPKEGGRNQ